MHDDFINVTYVITAIDRATRTVTQSQRSVHREADKVNRSFAEQATQQERVGVAATRSSRSVVVGEVDKRREVQRTTREVRKQTSEWDTLRDHSISDNDAMTRAFAKFRYELAAGGGGIRNISRNVRNMGDSFDRSGNKIVRANRNFMFLGNTIKLLKWPAIIAGAGALLQIFSSLAAGTAALGTNLVSATGALVSFGAALAPASGALAAYPAVILAVVQGLGVAKLAFGEIGKAIQGNAQALKRLTPEGKAFVRAWNKNFKPVFKSIQSDAQKALLPGLTKALETVAHSPLLGVIRKNVTATAGVLGKLAQQMARTLAAPATAKDLGTVLRGNTGFLNSLGKGAISVVHGFIQIGVAMQPMIKWFGQLAQEAGRWFDRWAEGARSSGRLTRFFEHSRQVLSQLGRIVRDVGVALLHIFKAAAPEGQSFLNIIERAARSLRRWTESLRGKNTLREYFKGAADSAKGWGRILRDTGIALFNIFKGGSKLGRSMNTDLQRAAATFRRWTESASGQNKIRKFFTDAKPAIYETARLIGAVVKAFASLGAHQGAAPLIRQIRTQLVPALQKLIDATTRQFAPVLIQTLIALATAISNLSGSSGPLVVFLKTINLLLDAFNALISNVRFLQPLLFALLGTAAVGRAVKLAGGILNIRGAWSKVTTSMKAAEVQADRTALAMRNASAYQPRGTQTGLPPAVPPPTFRQRFAQRLRGGVALPGQYYDPYGTGPMPLIPGGRANLGPRFKGLASGVGFGNIAAFGGLAAGSFLGNQGTAGKVGNVLSSAGIGAMLGNEVFPGWGAAIGAVGGALIAANQSWGIFTGHVTESQKAMEHYNKVVEQGTRDLDAYSQAHENLKNAQINSRDATTRLLGAQIQWHDVLKEQQKAFKGMDAAQIEAFKKTDKGKRIVYDVRTAFGELIDAEKEVTQAHKDQGKAFGDVNKGARKSLHDTLNAATAARKQVQGALADVNFDFRLAKGDTEGRNAAFDKARAKIVASFIQARESFAKDAREKGYKLVADVAQAQANAARALGRVPTKVQVAVALSEIHARRLVTDINKLLREHGVARITPKLWDNKGFQRNIIRLLHQYGIANISPELVGTDKFRKTAEPFLAKYKLLSVTPVIKKPKLPPVKDLADVGKYINAVLQGTFAPVIAAVGKKQVPTTKLGATLAVTDLSVQRLLGIKRMPPRSVVIKPGVETSTLRTANHLLGKQGDGLTHDRTAKIDVLAPDLPTALTQLTRVTKVKTRETTVKVNVIPVFPSGDGIVGIGGLGDGIVSMAKKAVKNNPATALKALGNLAVKGGAAVKGLKDFILDDLALAEKFGLALSSGFREGAVTSTGNVSLHSVGQAIDVTGAPGAMAAYAKAEAGRKGIAEVIYTGPGGKGGWYPGVGWTTSIPKSVLDDHHDHVHVGARFRGGGWAVPGARVAADTVPALLSPGEVVFTDSGQQMMEQVAPGLLNHVIANQAPHFRAGGVVQPQRFRTGGPTLPGEDPHTNVAVAPPPPWVEKFNALTDPERKKRRKRGNVHLPVGYFWYEDNSIGIPKAATKAARDVALPEMRAENFKLMKRIWNAAREFYPHATKAMPPVYGTGKDQSWLGPGIVAEVWQWAKGNDKTGAYAIPPGQRKVAWPLFAAGPGANKNPWTNLRKNGARRALIHEWAHVFQWPDLARWEVEGGAEAFTKRHGKQIFNKLGLPFQFVAADTEYDKFRQRVEKKPRAAHWIDADQFESPEKFRRGGWARFKGGTKKKKGVPKGTTFPKVGGPVKGLLPGAFGAGYDVGTSGGQLDFSSLYQLPALQPQPKPAKKQSQKVVGKTGSAAMSLAAKLAQSIYGWSGAQWAALSQLWQHESHFDYKAVNKASPHAVGIPQRNPQAWPITDDYRTNPQTQIEWGLNYIHDKYGTPAKAWAVWQAYAAKHGGQGSYRRGGIVQRFKGGGKPKPKSTFISKAANAATGVYPQILPLLTEKKAREMAMRFGQEGFADMLDDQTHIGKMERVGEQAWKVPLKFSGPNPATLDLKLWRTDEHTFYGRARHLKSMRKGGVIGGLAAATAIPTAKQVQQGAQADIATWNRDPLPKEKNKAYSYKKHRWMTRKEYERNGPYDGSKNWYDWPRLVPEWVEKRAKRGIHPPDEFHDSLTGALKKLWPFRRGGLVGRAWRRFRTGTTGVPSSIGSYINAPTSNPASALPTIRGTLGNLTDIKGDTRKARERAIKFLKDLNRELQSKTYEQIENVERTIKGEIRKLREGGVTPEERTKITRLRAALSEAEANLGFRIGSLVKQVQDLGTKQARRENRGGLKLRSDVATGRFEESSVEYANRAQDLIATQNDDLRQRIKLQREALTKAKARGNKHVIAEVQQGLNDLNDQLAEGIVSWREAAKNVADTMKQAAKDASDKIIASIQDSLANITSQASGFDAYQRLQGTADTPAGMRAKAGFIINKVIPGIQAGAAKVSPAFNPSEPGGHTFGLGDALSWLGVPKAATGGHIDPSPGGTPLIVGEGGYRETVLSSDPSQRSRTDSLLGQFLSSTGRMAASGFQSFAPAGQDVQDWINSSVAAGPTTVSPGLAKAMAAQGESFGAKNEDTIAWLKGLGAQATAAVTPGADGAFNPQKALSVLAGIIPSKDYTGNKVIAGIGAKFGAGLSKLSDLFGPKTTTPVADSPASVLDRITDPSIRAAVAAGGAGVAKKVAAAVKHVPSKVAKKAVKKMAEGGHITPTPGGTPIIVGEGGYHEVVLTADPKYAARTDKILSNFLRKTGRAAMRAIDVGGGFDPTQEYGGIPGVSESSAALQAPPGAPTFIQTPTGTQYGVAGNSVPIMPPAANTNYPDANDAAKQITDFADQFITALADAADLLKQANAKEASDITDMAQHRTSLATIGEQSLALQGKLAGLSDAQIAQQQGGYIQANVIPAMNDELAALKNQIEVAQQDGDPALVRQLQEAYGNKQNEIAEQQLEVMQDMKTGIEALAKMGSGSVAFQFGGQDFTDLVGATLGV